MAIEDEKIGEYKKQEIVKTQPRAPLDIAPHLKKELRIFYTAIRELILQRQYDSQIQKDALFQDLQLLTAEYASTGEFLHIVLSDEQVHELRDFLSEAGQLTTEIENIHKRISRLRGQFSQRLHDIQDESSLSEEEFHLVPEDTDIDSYAHMLYNNLQFLNRYSLVDQQSSQHLQHTITQWEHYYNKILSAHKKHILPILENHIQRVLNKTIAELQLLTIYSFGIKTKLHQAKEELHGLRNGPRFYSYLKFYNKNYHINALLTQTEAYKETLEKKILSLQQIDHHKIFSQHSSLLSSCTEVSRMTYECYETIHESTATFQALREEAHTASIVK